MMRLSALKPTSEKVVKLHMHPTHPWLTYADTNDNVVVWDWDHRQVLYEIKAGGVDERRLAGAQLQKIAEGEPDVKAKAAEGIKGGSVKHIRFYDDDVRFWQTWINRAAAGESPVAVNQKGPPIGAGPMTIRGRHFLVICCENKVIFQDLVSMKSRDVSKSLLENRSPLCVEFLPRSIHGDGPLAAFGGSDGIIRVLSMSSWQLVRRYAGGHKGSVFCLTTFLSSTGESLLISGGSDGLLVFWPADNLQATREVTHKLALKAHDGGVTGMDIVRVQGSSPLLVTIGADKTLAVWQTSSLKEFKRVKPVQKLACHSVASWCHPRVPGINILTCVKDSHIWAIESVEAFGTSTRALCDLSAQLPASMQLPNKKLKVYCMAAHPLQPNLVATGTNFGVFLSEFDVKAVPAAVALPTPAGSREHNVICASNRELKLLSFQLSQYPSGAPGHAADLGRARAETVEALQFQVKQIRRPVVSLPHDSYSWISTSKSGKYVSVVWPDVPAYAVYNAKDWNIVDSGQARYFAWDSCKERYALIQLIPGPKLPPALKGGSKKAREAAAQAAAVAAAAAASAAVSASVEVRILLDDGSSNLLAKAIEGRNEPVAGLQGGALLGVAYKMSQKSDMHSAAAALAAHRNGSSSADEGFAAGMCLFSESPPNFQLYSWETFQPVGGLLPQPVWSTWDEAVEFCALAFEHYVAICSLRPRFRYLGNVGIESATGGVWHRRQLFVATPTTIECVFVDAGVNAADLEWKAKTKELKALEEQSNAVAQHGELALITVEVPKASTSCEENLPLRPPMLQVVRLASFQSPPSVPPFLGILKQPPIAEPDTGGTMKELEEKKVAEVAVAGGGVSVAISRLPPEQKRPVGPLVVIGVRDGVLWLVDRYMAAHAIGLTHPGIRCRCLAAYGDPVSAVKWASRLGREHHDDFAQFMLGMGYAQEALHLPGISKRLEYELAMESGDLKRALHCLVTLSNSKDSRLQLELESGFQELGRKFDAKVEMVNTVAKAPQPIIQDNEMYTLFGIANFAGEYLRLIDAADATGKREINSQALRRLAAADTVPDAFEKSALRGLALRLAMHGEMSRLAALASTLIAAGQGHEGALAAALLGDSSLLEKALQEAGLFAEAALHAHAHGRGSLKTLLEHWYRSLDKEENQRLGTKAEAPVSAIPSSGTPFRHVPISFGSVQPDRHPLVEIIPPGNVLPAPAVTGPSLHQSTATNRKTSGQHAERALMIEMPSMVLGAVPPPLSLPRSVGEGAILPIASGVSGGLVPSAGPVSAPDPFAAHKPDGIFAAFLESPFTATEPLGSTFKPS